MECLLIGAFIGRSSARLLDAVWCDNERLHAVAENIATRNQQIVPA
jgi:hypothetical protein